MDSNADVIHSVIRRFYPTHDAESLSNQKNALAVLNHLTDNEVLEGVIFAKSWPCEGALWVTNKRLIFIGLDRRSKTLTVWDHYFEKVLFIAAQGQKIILLHADGGETYEDIDKKACLNEFIELVRSKLSRVPTQTKYEYLKLVIDSDGKPHLKGWELPKEIAWSDIANLLGEQGWELVSAYYTPSGASWGSQHFVFRRLTGQL